MLHLWLCYSGEAHSSPSLHSICKPWVAIFTLLVSKLMDLVGTFSNALPTIWYPKSTTKMDYFAFCFNQYFYMMHKTNKSTRVVSMFIEHDYAITCQDVKDKCTFVANGLINELDGIFLAQKLMNAISIIYVHIGYN